MTQFLGWARPRVEPDAPPPPPDAAAMALAQMIGQCMGHAAQSERLKLVPSREAKVNGVIDRQAVILRMLAMIADEVLVSRGMPRSLEWKAVPANGAGVVEGA